MKKFIQETGFFLLFTLLALALLPFILHVMDLRSQFARLTRLEELFLSQMVFILFLITLVIIYLLRFILSWVLKKYIGSAGKGEKP